MQRYGLPAKYRKQIDQRAQFPVERARNGDECPALCASDIRKKKKAPPEGEGERHTIHCALSLI
ncbi:MAG: hypothetical protein LBS12_01785 [Prevotellaceae bacterium]|jgi:hypothetical protein|nr:hypothetical protein [Prevotellaceae bacterium]